MTVVQASAQGSDNSLEEQRRYSYSPGFFKVILGFVFFGGGGLYMSYAAATNQRGLVIDGMIHLSPDHACTFYFVLAGICFAMSLTALCYVLPQSFISRSIILHSNAITLPGTGFDGSHYRFAASEIESFRITVVKKRQFLKIYTADRSFPVNPTWLSEPGALREIVGWLAARVPRQMF